ncbi:MAG: hypothetical protein AAFY78_21790 [Cyanobacteria bacterium J06648_16]
MGNQTKKLLAVALLGGLALSGVGVAHLRSRWTSPYRQQTDSPVVGLTIQEVDDLLNGRGAGYARMAELNSYPGPRHVLDLKQPLDLTVDQAQSIQATFDQMQADAQRLGRQIVEQEQQLSQAFADDRITRAALRQQLDRLAQLYADLRAVHLEAHMAITPILTAAQIERYDRLRGYGQLSSQSGHTHSH